MPNDFSSALSGINFTGKVVSLPEKLCEKLRIYYFNRFRQRDVKWNKQADLTAIFDVTSDLNWSAEAVAGTFFFQEELKSGNIKVYVVDVSSIPNARCLIVKKESLT